MRVDGYNILTDRETSRTLDEFDSQLCKHCGGHFRVIPGSGKTRGWCGKCGVTCGAPACLVHRQHFSEWVDQVEHAGRIILASR